jgi:CheY-like chemotaxis protein
MATSLPGILIVDDNEDNRYTLQLLLESDGHERIASAASGKEAIALIEKEKFSLVLLDLMMPDLNGDEVLKVIKSDPDKRDMPVVMISADTDADKVSQCIEFGADDYLPKPFNPTILRAHRSGPAQALAKGVGKRICRQDREREASFREPVAQHFAGRDRDPPAQWGKQHR